MVATQEHITTVEDPHADFDLRALPMQIRYECVFENGYGNKADLFGDYANNELGYCNTLISRLYDLIANTALMEVLDPPQGVPSVLDDIDDWANPAQQSEAVLRLSVASLTYEHTLREIIVNSIGRHLLARARSRHFMKRPIVVIIDEAHQFFGRSVADELVTAQFDAFDIIAKEGRKYGLFLCLSTQRPGDLPQDALSQVGTVIAHRLTEKRDRERIEQSVADLDRSMMRLLPTLTPGEALIVGADAGIPAPVRMYPPSRPPQSQTPDFGWRPHKP